MEFGSNCARFTILHLDLKGYTRPMFICYVSYIWSWKQQESMQIHVYSRAFNINTAVRTIHKVQHNSKMILSIMLQVSGLSKLSIGSFESSKLLCIIKLLQDRVGQNSMAPILLGCPSGTFALQTLLVCVSEASSASRKAVIMYYSKYRFWYKMYNSPPHDIDRDGTEWGQDVDFKIGLFQRDGILTI